jgi:hypothetical protein
MDFLDSFVWRPRRRSPTEHGHLVSAADQTLRQTAADESAAARDYDSHPMTMLGPPRKGNYRARARDKPYALKPLIRRSLRACSSP